MSRPRPLNLLAAAILGLVNYTVAQHGTVGRPCEVSTDCGTGNYCAGNKRCACLTTYVEIDSYCWRSGLSDRFSIDDVSIIDFLKLLFANLLG